MGPCWRQHGAMLALKLHSEGILYQSSLKAKNAYFSNIILMIFRNSGMDFLDKIGLKSNGKCHPSSKGSFFLTFLLKIGSWAVLEASWTVLAKFLGRLGHPRRFQDALLGPQDGPKTRPRPTQERPKTPPKTHLPAQDSQEPQKP